MNREVTLRSVGRTFTLSMRRINVILGANGSGKSNALANLSAEYSTQFRDLRSLICVEGGRAIQIPATSGPAHTSPDLVAIENEHRNGQAKSTLNQRLQIAFRRIIRLAETADMKYAAEKRAWQHAPTERRGSEPSVPDSPLDRLSQLVHAALPHIAIEFDPAKKEFACCRDSTRYPLAKMSDGEKQSLCLLMDLAILGDAAALVLIDEPELNLHALLAAQLWATIEEAKPESVFVYATHSVFFAMRPTVDTVIVLPSGSQRAPIVVSEITSVPREELRSFLDVVPALVVTSSTLGVEGDDSSFDVEFYRWLCGPNVSVAPLGDCESVRAAARGADLWSEMSTGGASVAGIIDRDYRTDERLRELANDGLIVLPLHEAESYLCIPSVVVVLAEKLGLVEPPTIDQVTDTITAFAKAQRERVAVRRTAERARVSLAVSIPRRVFDKLRPGDLIDALSRLAAEEERKAASWVGRDAVQSAYDAEVARLDAAIQTNDIPGLLALLPGKELLGALRKLIGAGCANDCCRAASKHLAPTEFALIDDLQAQLRKVVGAS